MIEAELIKDVFGFEGLYQITNYGNVISLRNGILLKQSIANGYYNVTLKNNGKQKTYNVHRLVAEHFLERIVNKNNVNHIDGVKTNNHYLNIEWCTHLENMQHASKTGLFKPRCRSKKERIDISNRMSGGLNPTATKIKNTITGEIFETMKEGANICGCCRQTFSKKLKNIIPNDTCFVFLMDSII